MSMLLWMGWPGALAAPLDPTPLLGTYAVSESPAAVQARVDAAVERSVDSLPWAFRGIARSRMKARPWCRTWTLASEKGHLVVGCAEHDAEVKIDLATHQGSTRGRDGETVPVEAAMADGRLVLTLRGDQGTSVRTFARSERGLQLQIVSSSDRLPEPLRFQIHYAPKPAP